MYAERTQREDLVHFVNACFACTGQREFYEDTNSQQVSISFLHEYVLGNYRAVYARTLAAGINHFNQSQIILRLLASGRDALPGEGDLIAAALRKMPPQRAWKTLGLLRKQGVNNRRTRAIVRDYFRHRDATFDAVKYRNKVKAIATHCHLGLPGEIGPYLFDGNKGAPFTTPLLEQARKARFSAEAVYDLPFTVAEGLAAKHGIPRDVFLKRIEPRMTAGERLRFHDAGDLAVDYERMPLTKLALFALSREQPDEAIVSALDRAALRTLDRSPLSLGRVAAVLDNSYSTLGTREKKLRPLAVAIGVDHLLSRACRDYRSYWTASINGWLPSPKGATNLSSPILVALAGNPDLLVIVTDGVENDPPGGAAMALKLWKERLDPKGRTTIVHLNPVFSASDYAPLSLSEPVPTVGLRDAEDLPTVLAFARFARGDSSRAELEAYLDARVRSFLNGPM